MELHEALSQIGEIQARLARTEVVTPSRSLTVGGVGLLGCAASLAQTIWIPEPMSDLDGYLMLWLGVATLSAAIVAIELIVRRFRDESEVTRRATWQAVEQFVPCLVAGSCFTLAIGSYAREAAILLPGLWAITFGLGIFAALRQLPAAAGLAAAYFLCSGTVALSTAAGPHPLSPWAMVGTFGFGHFILAAAIFFGLERRHGTN
jgi:hypothetical protein